METCFLFIPTNADMIYKYALIAMGIIGGVIALWRAFSHHKEAEVERRGGLTDRIVRGTEQLLSDKELVRSAGVFFLSNAYNEAKDELDKKTVCNILCCFLRQNLPNKIDYTNWENQSQGEDDYSEFLIEDDWYSLHTLNSDIVAALDLIFSLPKKENEIFDVHGLNLTDYVFGQRNFSNINFQRSLFGNSTIEDIKVYEVNFKSSFFIYSKIRNVIFTNTNFEDCNLERSNLNNCTFIGSNLSGALFNSSNISDSIFSSAKEDLNWKISFKGAVIQKSKFKNINTPCDFGGSIIHETSFKSVIFEENSFRKATLIDCKFYKCFYLQDGEKIPLNTNFFNSARSQNNIHLSNFFGI